VGLYVTQSFLDVRDFKTGGAGHLPVVTDRRACACAEPGKCRLHHRDVCLLAREDVGKGKYATWPEDSESLVKDRWAIIGMYNRFLTHNGVPRIRFTVDVMEVPDHNLNTTREPCFRIDDASTVHAAFRDVEAFRLAAQSGKRPQRSAETACNIQDPITVAYTSVFDQMRCHSRRGFPDGFVAGRVKADMYVFTAPTLLVKL